mgnify:CR=1 FL=1
MPQTINIEKNTPVSVYDLIASFQYKYPVFLPQRKKLKQNIIEALKVFEAEDLIDKQVCNLSGGQLQRVLLSMAIMDKPNLLLLDEPVSGIDKNGMELFYKTMDYLKTHYDLAIILISHDLDYVAKYADRVILLDKTVLKQGSTKEVFGSKEFEEVFRGLTMMGYAVVFISSSLLKEKCLALFSISDKAVSTVSFKLANSLVSISSITR